MKRNIFLYILGVIYGVLFTTQAVAVNSLRLEPLEIPSEGITTVNVYITTDQEIIGFQTEVKIPYGLSLIKTDDNYCYYPDNASQSLMIRSNLVGNILKVAGLSDDNSAYPSSGILFSFKVQPEIGFTGENLSLDNTIFTTSDFIDIEINHKKVNLILLSHSEWSGVEGSSVKLTATVYPENAINKNIVWSSSDESVAIVAEDGTVTAVKPGNAVITATAADDSGINASCNVTVTAKVIPVTAITLSATEWSGVEGDTFKLTATISPEDATNSNIVWSSSDESVATVAEDGTVTAVKPGNAVITATAADDSGVKASCNVTVTAKVIPVTAITLSATEWSGVEGNTFKLTATISPEDATNSYIVWSSSDESVATVAEDGTVTAVKPGNAVITATAANDSGVKASCNVTVTAKVILAETLTIDPKFWNGNVGESFRITAVITPENTTDKTLKWSSSDESIASVDETGLVTVLKEGNCIITVSTVDGSNLSEKCPITGVSGIKGIFIDETTVVDVYSTQGILIRRNCNQEVLKQLRKGVYIVRTGNKATTIIIR